MKTNGELFCLVKNIKSDVSSLSLSKIGYSATICKKKSMMLVSAFKLRLGIISSIERFQRLPSLTEDSSGWTSSSVLFLLPGICASSAAGALVYMWAVSKYGFHCDSLAFLVGWIPNLHSQWEQVDGGWWCTRLCGGEKEWDNHRDHRVSADRDSQLSLLSHNKFF